MKRIDDELNLMQIYMELSENKSDDYYVDVSDDEILLVPVLIEIMGNSKYPQRLKACGILDKISRKRPDRLCPFAEYLLKAVKKYDDFPQWCMLKVISNIIGGITNYAELFLEILVESLGSDNIGKFSIACDCVLTLSDHYPSVVELFIAATSDIEQRSFKIGNDISDSCKNVAAEKVNSVIDSLKENGRL